MTATHPATTTLTEALIARQRLAAQRATDAAGNLESAGERDATAQLALEEALADLAHYTDLKRELGPLAGEIGEYRRGGRSILRDLKDAPNDRAAAARIVAHGRSFDDHPIEHRDLGASSVFGSVPTWLVTDAAPTSINVAPLVNLVAKPLPEGVTGSVNLIRWGTPPTAAAQAAQNASITTPSIVDGTAGPVVRTYATRVKVSRQFFDAATANGSLDALLTPALMAAVDAQLDFDILNADGTSGTVTGIRSTSSISATTYTDAAPTLAKLWTQIETNTRLVEIGFGGKTPIICHPRRLSYFRQRALTEGLNLNFDSDAAMSAGVTTTILGRPIIADPNITVTNGAGTNEDVVINMRGTDSLDLFVGPHRVQVGDVPVDPATPEVYINVFRYAAFTAARLPASLGVVSGTGLVAP